MSRRSSAARRAAAAQRVARRQVFKTCGWCERPDELDELEAAGRQVVVEQLGDHVPVTHLRYSGMPALVLINRMVNQAYRDGDAAAGDEFVEIRGLLRRHGGFLVITTAPVAAENTGGQVR